MRPPLRTSKVLKGRTYDIRQEKYSIVSRIQKSLNQGSSRTYIREEVSGRYGCLPPADGLSDFAVNCQVCVPPIDLLKGYTRLSERHTEDLPESCWPGRASAHPGWLIICVSDALAGPADCRKSPPASHVFPSKCLDLCLSSSIGISRGYRSTGSRRLRE